MQVDLSFTEPRFLDRNLSAGFDLFYKQLDYQNRGGLQSEEGRSARFVSGSRSPKTCGCRRITRFRVMKSSMLRPNASLAVKEACGDTTGLIRRRSELHEQSVSGRRSSARRSPTTSVTMPRIRRAATISQLADDFAGLGGDAQYWRVNAEARGYYPITEKITFVGRVIGGTHPRLGWPGRSPARCLLQGWRDDPRLRPLPAMVRAILSSPNHDALGGQTYWAATAEVRFPLP